MVDIDKDLIEIYENVKQSNDDVIKNYNSITGFIMILSKDNKNTIIPLLFKNYEEKIKIRKIIKKIILNTKIRGYILICDTLMTKIDKNNNRIETYDCCLRNLYTPKGSIRTGIIHKDKKVIEKLNMNDLINQQDEWDLWGESVNVDNKLIKIYNDHKNKHKKRYKGVQ